MQQLARGIHGAHVPRSRFSCFAACAATALAAFAPVSAFAQAPPPGVHITRVPIEGATESPGLIDLSRDGGAAVGITRMISVSNFLGWSWEPPNAATLTSHPGGFPAMYYFEAVSERSPQTGQRTTVGRMGLFESNNGGPGMQNPTGYRYSVRAFRKVGDGPEQILGVLGGYERSYANAVSADGNVVAGVCENGQYLDSSRAFVWTPQTGMQAIPRVSGSHVVAEIKGMSADGAVIVGNSGSIASGFRGFKWTQQTGTVALPAPSGTGALIESYARGVSSNGQFIVGTMITQTVRGPAIWNGMTPTILSYPPQYNFGGYLSGINDEGTIAIGALSGTGGLSNHFIWTSALGWEDPDDYFLRMGVLLPEGWNTNWITDISADGRVFALYGASLLTGEGGFSMVVVPSVPGTLALIVGLGAVRVRARRRHREG